ncbi:MAG: hypothetical protein CSA07_04365 [Bacteroidia bacterium]|nr:MAG: hypothetical protein CSA07_04365 [Bacteroidia bacterium]
MRSAKKFVKLYEEAAEQDKGRRLDLPKSWDEVHALEQRIDPKYFQNEDAVLRTKAYLGLLGQTRYFGFYLAMRESDFALLNNVLFQTSRHALLAGSVAASGTDHSVELMNVLSALSCNDIAVVDAFLPRDLPLCRGSWYAEVAVNLLCTLYYNEPERLPEARVKAEKFLSKKGDTWGRGTVLYLLALIDKDAQKAGEHLQALCVSYQRLTHSGNKSYNALEKCFAEEIHGLYRFARMVDEDLFASIAQPNHACFSREFEAWQRQQGYPEGEQFYVYPPELEYMNRILRAELPHVRLEPPLNKREVYRDEEQFAKDLTENALRSGS